MKQTEGRYEPAAALATARPPAAIISDARHQNVMFVHSRLNTFQQASTEFVRLYVSDTHAYGN